MNELINFMIQSQKSRVLLLIKVFVFFYKIPNSTAVFTVAFLKLQKMSLKSFP